jgi:hypothetical protein
MNSGNDPWRSVGQTDECVSADANGVKTPGCTKKQNTTPLTQASTKFSLSQRAARGEALDSPQTVP